MHHVITDGTAIGAGAGHGYEPAVGGFPAPATNGPAPSAPDDADMLDRPYVDPALLTPETPWLPDEAVIHDMHRLALAVRGGGEGVLNAGAISSALSRPYFVLSYGADSVDLFELVSTLMTGLAKNHPFLDGNKRVAYFTGYATLWQNGFHLPLSEHDAVLLMQAIAEAGMSDVQVSDVLRRFCVPRDPAALHMTPAHLALGPDGAIHAIHPDVFRSVTR